MSFFSSTHITSVILRHRCLSGHFPLRLVRKTVKLHNFSAACFFFFFLPVHTFSHHTCHNHLCDQLTDTEPYRQRPFFLGCSILTPLGLLVSKEALELLFPKRDKKKTCSYKSLKTSSATLNSVFTNSSKSLRS